MNHRLFTIACVPVLLVWSAAWAAAPTREELERRIEGKQKSIEAVEKRIKTRTVKIRMHEACRDLHPEYYTGSSYHGYGQKRKVVIGGGAVCDGHIHKIRERDPVSGHPMTVSHGCPSHTGGKLQDGIHQAISRLERDNEGDAARIAKWEEEIETLTSKLAELGE